MTIDTPWIIEADYLIDILGEKELRIIDLTNQQSYDQAHISNAVFVDYKQIIKNQPPTFGLLPSELELSQLLSKNGISPNHYIIAYDDEGGGKASRLLWTLDLIGHKKMSLLNGGIQTWLAKQFPVSTQTTHFADENYPVQFKNKEVAINAEQILQKLEQNKVKIIDARSKKEFLGEDVRATKAGHIPNAVHFDWMDLKKPDDVTRLKTDKEISEQLHSLNIQSNDEIIVHCHSHHRSSLSYVVLKHLGYKNVKGYPGSWSDWGNRSDTPTTTIPS